MHSSVLPSELLDSFPEGVRRSINTIEMEIIGSFNFTRNLAENIEMGCKDGR